MHARRDLIGDTDARLPLFGEGEGVRVPVGARPRVAVRIRAGEEIRVGHSGVALDEDERSVVVGDVRVLVHEHAEVDGQPVPRRLVLQKDANGPAARDLGRLVGVEAGAIAGLGPEAVGRAEVVGDGAPAVGEGDLLFLVVAVVGAELDQVAGAEEGRQVRGRQPILETLVVFDVVAEARDAVAQTGIGAAVVADAPRVDRVEGRLERNGNRRVRALRVVVVVELEIDVEVGSRRPVPVEDADAVDLLRRRARRGGGVEVDVRVVLVDASVAERGIDELVGDGCRRELQEVFLDVEVGVGQRPGQVGPVLLVLVEEVDRAVGEEVILPDRPADADAGTEALELGLNLALAAGLEGRGRVIETRLAVEDVGARLRDAVDDEAARPAVLGRDAAALDVDFLDVELGEILVEVAEERVRDVDAVVEERVVLAPSAGVDADVRVGDLDAAVDDSRRELEGPGEGPLQRELLEGLPLGDLRDLRRFRVDERRGRGDGHLLGRRRPEHRPDLRHLGEADDGLLLEGAHARQLDANLVIARREVEKLEDAVLSRGRGAAERELGTGDRDGRSRHRGAGIRRFTTPVTEPVVWARARPRTETGTRANASNR